jgi:hypothetical protein
MNRAETAGQCRELASEIRGIADTLSQVLSWVATGERAEVVAGVLEFHPHILLSLADKVEWLAKFQDSAAVDELTKAAIDRARSV